MPLRFEILRPDDLVVLDVEAINLKLDRSRPGRPRLLVENAAQEARLVFTFPPQTLLEQAFFETQSSVPDTSTHTGTGESLPPPGLAGARLAGPSRLAFRLPHGASEIDYSIEGLLDWSRLELVLSPVAAIPDGAPPPAPAPPIAPPGDTETAVEIPYRLTLSPAALQGRARPAFAHARTPVVNAGRAELWHTRLVHARAGKGAPRPTLSETSERDPLPVRAVWSPDFVSGGPLPPHSEDDIPFRAPMTARDRDQIVILTSGFEGYSVATVGAEIPYVPKPVEASKLYLSALGGWLSSNGAWPDNVLYRYFTFLDRPAVAAPPPPQLEARVPDGPIGVPPLPLPTATQVLDLVAWRHVATQGRDHYVKIVYDGYAYGFGHRASLVKVTERQFVGPGPGLDTPVAYLRERMFVVFRELVKDYTGEPFAYGGREMPFAQVRIDTKTSPDINPPTYIGSGSFWIDVGAGHFPFKLTATDLAGKQIDFHAALIFVPLSETSAGLAAVKAAYVADDVQRRCDVKGRNIAYADPNAGDTTFKTTALYFDTEIIKADPPWPTAPFLPVLDRASVTVPSISNLLGRQVAVLIGYYQPYLQVGMDLNAGVFADIVANPPGVGFTADKAGGLATPNLTLNALSARKGLVSGSADHAAQGVIAPSEYFGPMDAKLFGTIPLGDLIPIDPSTLVADATHNSPEIRCKFDPNRTSPVTSTTHIIWKPDLTDYKPPGSVLFCEFNQDSQASELSLRVEIVRKFDGTPPSTTAKGRLSNFRLTLLGIVAIKVQAIDFTSQDHEKTIVVADLAANHAIVFEGALSFIQTLSDILPPGLFGGSGPNIQVTPKALRVTYTLGLPAITAGAFSLQNIALMAGVDLPWLDGKPGFEFAFASRSKPFLVTVEIFGGGGFVHLLIDADGVQMVEASIEFGGNFAFDVGVASGGVHAMAGVYIQLATQSTTLTGFVDIGGEVSVLGIISISLDLNLSLSWIENPQGKFIDGKATMSISVHIIFFSISVSVTVERKFQAGSGDPQVWQLMNDNQWSQYAEAFA